MKEMNRKQFKLLLKSKFNVKVSNKEYEILNGYIKGHGYYIKVNKNKNTYIAYTYDKSDIELENLQDIIERVLTWNMELYEEYENLEDEKEYYKCLKEDEKILDEINSRFYKKEVYK